MKKEQCRTTLTDLLQAHISCIGSANDYLLAIKSAIAENRLEQLQQSLSEPPLALTQIEALEQQRQQLLSGFGFDADDDGFVKCIRWCDDDGQLDALYQQLIQNLTRLQHSIQLNCLLVSKGQERVRRSIGILTGLGAAQSAKIYGKSGKTQGSGGQRDIAIA